MTATRPIVSPALRLRASAFKTNSSAANNQVFLWTHSKTPPFMRAKQGWRIVGWGKAPWPKPDLPLAVMFERVVPPSNPYGDVHGNEMTEGTRIWQHGRARWIPDHPDHEKDQ